MWWSSAQGGCSHSSIYDLRMAKSMYFEQSLTDAHYGIRRICGDEVADKCKPLWGMDEEGEINGCWKDLGVPGLWYIMGMLLLFRRENSFLLSFIRARFPLSFFRDTRASFLLPSLLFPGDLCPSSFFPGNALPAPRKKLTVLLRAIGNLALCRFYSKTIALRTPVSFSFRLQMADMYMYARNQSHGGRTFQYALWWVCIR